MEINQIFWQMGWSLVATFVCMYITGEATEKAARAIEIEYPHETRQILFFDYRREARSGFVIDVTFWVIVSNVLYRFLDNVWFFLSVLVSCLLQYLLRQILVRNMLKKAFVPQYSID